MDDTFYFRFCLLSRIHSAFVNTVEIFHTCISRYFNRIEKHSTYFKRGTHVRKELKTKIKSIVHLPLSSIYPTIF